MMSTSTVPGLVEIPREPRRVSGLLRDTVAALLVRTAIIGSAHAERLADRNAEDNSPGSSAASDCTLEADQIAAVPAQSDKAAELPAKWGTEPVHAREIVQYGLIRRDCRETAVTGRVWRDVGRRSGLVGGQNQRLASGIV